VICVAIITLPGFNELDSFAALHILNRAGGVTAFLAGPSREAVSMNGVATAISGTMAEASKADAVLVGSGLRTREFAGDPAFLESLELDPSRHLIASQCSGALILAKLGLLDGKPVCTDNTTRPWIEELGHEVVNASLAVSGGIATAGGCLSAQYIATWLLLRLTSEAETRKTLAYVVPVGEAEDYTRSLIERANAADPEGLRASTAALA